MKLRDLSFRDVFEKYLIFHCNWFLLTGGERDEWPWPEEADGVLVYGCDGIGDELSLVILCPVITKADTFLVDSSPEKVHANGFGLVGSVLENLLDVEVEIPDQDKMDRLGILSETVHWGNKDRKRMLAATSIDPLRTFSNYDTFETLIRCGEHGIVAAQVKLEDYQDGVFIGSLLEMLDDDIDVYENDKIKVQVGFVNKELLPVLVGEKIAYEEPSPKDEISPEQRAALELWTNGLGSSAKRFAGEDPMPPKRKKATRDSWSSRRDMPKRHEDFYLGIEITPAEKEVLEYGHIPMEMEDHWFMYYEDDVIHFHRSWTGYCMYEAKVEPCGDHFIITDACVNRYPGHYKGTDLEHDKYWLARLIMWEIGRD